MTQRSYAELADIFEGMVVNKRCCSIPECRRPHFGRGLCQMHYQRWRRHGSTEAPNRVRPSCSIEGCGEKAFANGYCRAHNWRYWKHGHPLAGGKPRGEIQKYIRKTTLVVTDECILWPFSKSAKGYGRARWKGRDSNAHRIVCELVHGKPPTPKHEAAHLCGNRACVNPGHLQWKTHA